MHNRSTTVASTRSVTRIATLQTRGRDRMIPLFRAQLRRENERYAVTEQELAIRAEATLTIENLAVCVVKVG